MAASGQQAAGGFAGFGLPEELGFVAASRSVWLVPRKFHLLYGCITDLLHDCIMDLT